MHLTFLGKVSIWVGMQNVCEQQLMTNCMRAEACVIIISGGEHVVLWRCTASIVCMHWCIAMSEQASKYNVSAFMLPVVLLLPQYLLLFGYRGTRGIALSANSTFKRCAHAVDDCYHRHYHSFIQAASCPALGSTTVGHGWWTLLLLVLVFPTQS